MQAMIETDVHRFADRVLPWAAREPVVNNVEAVRDGRRRYDGALWLTVLDAGQVVGVAHHTPPYALFVCPMPDAAVQVLAQAVWPVRPGLNGVSGVAGTAEAFAGVWRGLSGTEVVPGMAQRLYQLATLVAPRGVPGTCGVGSMADRTLLLDWSEAFHQEATPHLSGDGIRDVDAHRIANGEYLVWEADGRPVCFAGVSPPSAGVSRIGPVYTPPAHRGHGYASACVAAASQRALDSGARHCMLYTDLANPTSNAIYQKLGYRPVCDARQYAFNAGTPQRP
jgi:predicted GNAT family acetyltransferase